MKPHLVLAATVLLLAICLVPLASAEIAIGVKGGDWMEYLVSYSGAPESEHDLTWARMVIQSVQNPEISVKIISQFADNTSYTNNATLNLQTGHLIDTFVIPANLNVGDTFKDENYGTVTIDSSETRTYAGAQRTVIISTISNNTYVWDQKTGVNLEGNTETADYKIHTIVSATNLWEPQPTPPPQSLDFVSIVLVVAFAAIVLVAALIYTSRYMRRKACQARNATA